MFNYVCEVFFVVAVAFGLWFWWRMVFGCDINTQYQTFLHTCGQWHLQRFSCPDWRSLDKGKGSLRPVLKSHKCKYHPKKLKSNRNNLHFPAKACFSLRVLYLTEWLEIFWEFFCILWRPAIQSANYIYIEECKYWPCSTRSISS